MQILFSILFLLFFSVATATALAATNSFTVNSFDGTQTFTWNGGPTQDCSAFNSYVMTYPDNDQQSRLFACEETWGQSERIIPDGTYYIMLAVGEQPWKSPIFTIKDGILTPFFESPSPTIAPPVNTTPTTVPTIQPTLIPQHRTPVAIAGTSLDANGRLQLDASLSYDPNGNPLEYRWAIEGESVVRTGRKVSLATIQSGLHKVTLTVQNGTMENSDTMLFGIHNNRPASTIAMKVDKFSIDKEDGEFVIKGKIQSTATVFKKIAANPLSRITIELQTGGTQKKPLYGLLGENIYALEGTKNSYK